LAPVIQERSALLAPVAVDPLWAEHMAASSTKVASRKIARAVMVLESFVQ
jgi:hypothetical protein